MRTCLVVCCAALSTACTPETAYSPPPQKTLPQGAEAPLVHAVIRMRDADAHAFITQDILGSPGDYRRWTGQHPRFQLWLDDSRDRLFRMTFAIVPDTFRETGPVTIAITLNALPLASPRFDAPKTYDYSRAVPEALLRGSSPVIVGLDIDPVYITRPDRAKLGIYLESIGLPRAGE